LPNIKHYLKKLLMRDGLPNEAELRGLHLSSGDEHYRAWVGRPERYDVLTLLQFRILTDLGVREYHQILDLGCGSLRLGRLLIPFLLPHRYVGVEPERWLVEAGFEHEAGESIRRIKGPTFCFDGECPLDHFDRSFDYIMVQSVFTHAPLDWIERAATRLSKVLARPGGVVIANYLEGTSDYTGGQWLYPECGAYRRKTLEDLFAAAGLVWRELDYPHPAGVTWFQLSR